MFSVSDEERRPTKLLRILQLPPPYKLNIRIFNSSFGYSVALEEFISGSIQW